MTQHSEIPGNPAKPEATQPSEAPKTSRTSVRRQFPDDPNFLNDKVILDTNVLANFFKTPHEVLNKVGGRPIHHSAVIRLELAKYYKDPVLPLDDTRKFADSILGAFNSTLLPDTADMEKIAKIITHFLLLAGIQFKEVKAAKNDIRIMACGIVHKADIVTSDRLFYVMGKIFKTNIRIIFLGKPPEGWATTARNTLKNQGFSTPIDLWELALNQDFTQRVLGLQL